MDWRVGARHFLDLLVDGDIANNQLNWQWVAGTGTDTRPNRVLNPLTQAKRFDPQGDYVRRWVPELAGLAGAAVHQPWKLPGPSGPRSTTRTRWWTWRTRWSGSSGRAGRSERGTGRPCGVSGVRAGR